MGRIASRFLTVFTAAAVLLAVATTATAHPHVLISVQLELVYGQDGRITAIRHSWAYDPAYSAFVMHGFGAAADRTLSDRELAAFATQQLQALAEHSYFTVVKANDRAIAFAEPEILGVTLRGGGGLLLRFALPLKTAPATEADIVIEIHDPNFFAYFTMADDLVGLVGARAGCTSKVVGPQPINLKHTASIPAAFWQALDGSASASTQFVNRITVTCR